MGNEPQKYGFTGYMERVIYSLTFCEGLLLMNSNQEKTTPCTPECGCHSEINRRDLLRLAGTGAIAWSVSGLSAMAGPFDDSDFEKLVPRDKKLQPQWVKSVV